MLLLHTDKQILGFGGQGTYSKYRWTTYRCTQGGCDWVYRSGRCFISTLFRMVGSWILAHVQSLQHWGDFFALWNMDVRVSKVSKSWGLSYLSDARWRRPWWKVWQVLEGRELRRCKIASAGAVSLLGVTTGKTTLQSNAPRLWDVVLQRVGWNPPKWMVYPCCTTTIVWIEPIS